ncbi:unnamed protein product, partial [Ectocarpus sp. 12 AP-2014]
GKTEEEIEADRQARLARQKSFSGAKVTRDASGSDAFMRRQSSNVNAGHEIDLSASAGKKDAKVEEEKLPKPPRGRMWSLNKGDWP